MIDSSLMTTRMARRQHLWPSLAHRAIIPGAEQGLCQWCLRTETWLTIPLMERHRTARPVTVLAMYGIYGTGCPAMGQIVRRPRGWRSLATAGWTIATLTVTLEGNQCRRIYLPG